MMLHRLYLGFRSIFLRARLEREMREEMALHLEQATARFVARGMSPAAAAVAARREFGNIPFIQEQARDARGRRWIDAVKADVRFAFRHFARTPLSTVTMILVLALGIGVNTALFAAFQSIFTLPGPGIPRDDALVRIRGVSIAPESSRGVRGRDVTLVEAAEYGRQRQLFSGVATAVHGPAGANFRTVDPQRAALAGGTTYVSADYFELLRVRPALGGGLSQYTLDADPAVVSVAVITHALWESLFDSDPQVIGRTMRINDVAVTIVGVAPRGFRGTDGTGYRYRAWLPLAAYPVLEKSSQAVFTSPDSTAHTSIIARLRPGVTREQAAPTVKAIAARAYAQRSAERRPSRDIATADVVPLLDHNANAYSDGEMKLAAAGFGVLTLLILLVTCTNVSSLQVGMAVARRREIAVRLSLGAGRPRLIAQLLTESVLLALAAGALALFIVWTLMHVLAARFPDELPGEQLVLDWRATLFTCLFAVLTGVLFGLSPALHATRLALAEVLKDTAAAVSGTRSWLQRSLVVAQVTFTQPLLVAVGATVLLAFADLQRITGSTLDAQLVAMSFNTAGSQEQRERAEADLQRVRERLSAVPGVVGVTAESWDIGRGMIVHPGDRVDASTLPDSMPVTTRYAPPGFLALRDVPVLRGRDFLPEESDSVTRAVIIGDDLARRLFGSADPIGRRVRFARDTSYVAIVGVVDEARAQGVRRGGASNQAPLVFIASTRWLESTLLVRTAGDGAAMIPTLRTAAQAEVPQLPLSTAYTLQSHKDDTRRDLMLASSAIGAGGMLALLLSAIGLYAIVSFAVHQRTREIGIRTALGADRRSVVSLFFLSGVRLSLLGLLLGLPLSLIVLRLLLSEVGDADQVSTATVALVVAAGVLGVAALASWIPARRAAGIDPLQALRSE